MCVCQRDAHRPSVSVTFTMTRRTAFVANNYAITAIYRTGRGIKPSLTNMVWQAGTQSKSEGRWILASGDSWS